MENVLFSELFVFQMSGWMLFYAEFAGILKKATKTALFLCSGSPGVYEASERIYHGFVQGYFQTEDMDLDCCRI